MPHAGMAVDAIHILCARMRGQAANITYQIQMTANTVFVRPFRVRRTDPDRIAIVLQGELHRVVPAIVRFGEELGQKLMRHMAVIADRAGVVARFLPGSQVFAHDVTVGAGIRIVAEIGKPLRKLERVGAQPHQRSNEAAEQVDLVTARSSNQIKLTL